MSEFQSFCFSDTSWLTSSHEKIYRNERAGGVSGVAEAVSARCRLDAGSTGGTVEDPTLPNQRLREGSAAHGLAAVEALP